MVQFNLNAEERMKKNILNELDENDIIYRFIEVDRFFEMIEKKKLILVKPRKWDDPFEDFLSKAIVINSKGIRIRFNVTNDFYGQCWTLKGECDGMWRNYASLDDGVRIECKTLRLLEVIYDKNNRSSGLSCFIGRVIYPNDENNMRTKMKELISKMLADNSSGKEIAKILLIKRKEFSYEKEVRLLYFNEDSNDSDIITFNIEPVNIIESVYFSPKMDQDVYKEHKQKLVQYGFNENHISKSHLYEPYTIEIEYNGLLLNIRLLEIWILAFLEKYHNYNNNNRLSLFLRLT